MAHYLTEAIISRNPNLIENIDFSIYQNSITGELDIFWVPGRVPPSEQYKVSDFSATDIALSEISGARRTKINEFKLKCSEQIYSGFESSALGRPYHYPANDKDQSNLQASVLASTLPTVDATWTTPFWCQNVATGEWSFLPHTASQIQQVGLDAKASITAALMKNMSLSAQVAAASTVAEINSIVW